MNFKTIALLALVGSIVPAAVADMTISKDPDIGDYWHPLSSIGTYLYADTFVAPVSGSYNLTSIGIWLDGGSSEVKFELLDGTGGTPNGAAILTSSSAASFSTSGLTLETLSVSPYLLTAGHTYFIGASATGNGSGGYTVGGHSQNTEGINDNGTFWYSNDPNQLSFDGQNRTPEMAYQVHLQSVPEPMELLPMVLGAAALLRKRIK